MLRLFNMLKDAMEWSANETQENKRAEMRKIQKPKMSELKNLVGGMKNSLEGLTSRVTAADDQISKLEDEVQQNSRYQQNMGKASK